MHMAAVVEMTVIDIEFAGQLVLVGLGNADAEVMIQTQMVLPSESATPSPA